MGLDATQSTISRDIEELGLARVHDHEGTRYVVPGDAGSHGPMTLLRHLLDEFALSFVASGRGADRADVAGGGCRRSPRASTAPASTAWPARSPATTRS